MHDEAPAAARPERDERPAVEPVEPPSDESAPADEIPADATPPDADAGPAPGRWVGV